MKLKQTIDTIAIGIVVLFIITRPAIANAILSFLLGGVLPGVGVVLPFWVMLGVYLLLMTTVITFLYETHHPRPAERPDNVKRPAQTKQLLRSPSSQ